MKDINQLYFEMLFEKSLKTSTNVLHMHCPEQDIYSGIVPLPIASKEDLSQIHIVAYDTLEYEDSDLQNFSLNIVKMQAGLGTSVKRYDLIEEVQQRTSLGAKGTDLYFELFGKKRSIAEIQLLQAFEISKTNKFKEVIYQSLVNDETSKSVESTWSCKVPNSDMTYDQLFLESTNISRGVDLMQNKMPTIDETGQLTYERLAPAGHGFLGFLEIIDTFTNEQNSKLVFIGNGEDLNSTPDIKILNWVAKENIPIVMMTTTKTIQDKKGGQISLVKGAHPTYVTIIEKAQAEMTDQLLYFEQLGLREGDNNSLFNTNIVIINKKALKQIFDTFLKDIKLSNFVESFSPDVIKNLKDQDGKKFTQLESALGSVMLNLDRYMRLNFNYSVVSFLNLAEKDRKSFFMPIKKREDFNDLLNDYIVDPQSYRLQKKGL